VIAEEVGSVLTQIARRWNFRLDNTGQLNTWRMDIAIKQTDGSVVFQYVYIWLSRDHAGKDRLYMNSPCGPLLANSPLPDILREAVWCNYSCIAITRMKRADQMQQDEIVVQCVPSLTQATETLLEEMIYETAVNAQVIIQRFFSSPSDQQPG
jgi:hypothetical protein